MNPADSGARRVSEELRVETRVEAPFGINFWTHLPFTLELALASISSKSVKDYSRVVTRYFSWCGHDDAFDPETIETYIFWNWCFGQP
jgi:hypothetical protein